MANGLTDPEIAQLVAAATRDAAHAFEFLKESGTLTASLIFNIVHRLPDTDTQVAFRFPAPWARDKALKTSISSIAEDRQSVLNEPRIDADTLIHAHTPHLAAWSLAQQAFPIRYVAAQRHLLAREIPNHLDRTRSVLDVVRERLDTYPDIAPPPGLLESNGGANFWGRGIVRTAELILLIEESARLQAIAASVGGARDYTPGALEVQWRRTGLLEPASAYPRAFAPA